MHMDGVRIEIRAGCQPFEFRPEFPNEVRSRFEFEPAPDQVHELAAEIG
jgi:hypothetical protein